MLSKDKMPILYPEWMTLWILSLASSSWFSTLDLIGGYWQVEMSPEHREKTGFGTTEGLFEFNVMPFGFLQYSSYIPEINRHDPWEGSFGFIPTMDP